jgi:hypothetical protein
MCKNQIYLTIVLKKYCEDLSQYVYTGKGKIHPRIDHEGPEALGEGGVASATSQPLQPPGK